MATQPWLSRWQPGVLFLVQGILAISAIVAISNKAWLALFVAILSLVLTYVPALLRRWRVIDLPLAFEIGAAVFVLASMFLGNMVGYYVRFWWWDLLLHGTSAIAIGIAGYLLLVTLLQAAGARANPWLVAVFTFSFALAIGGLWELVEFSIDHVAGTHMQLNSLRDTMGDLAMDTFGAIIAGVAGWLHAKGQRGWGIIDRLWLSLRERNPWLTPRRRRTRGNLP